MLGPLFVVAEGPDLERDGDDGGAGSAADGRSVPGT